MIDPTILAVFIPTFFFVSATPGMCMTLAMTMGMTIGVRRTLWMMAGELIGVALVALAAVIGVAALMLNYPGAFDVFKYLGGAYLGYLGIQMWRSKGRMALSEDPTKQPNSSRWELATQGFITAVANPKGWAFFMSLLPPFIDERLAMVPQLSILLAMVVVIEFTCLMIYASGGRTLRLFLQRDGNVKRMNRISGTLMMGVGLWLATG